MLELSLHLVVRCKVSVPSVVLRQKVAALGIRIIEESIIHVFVIGADAFPEAHLLDPISVLESRLHTSIKTKALFTLSSRVRGSILLY